MAAIVEGEVVGVCMRTDKQAKVVVLVEAPYMRSRTYIRRESEKNVSTAFGERAKELTLP